MLARLINIRYRFPGTIGAFQLGPVSMEVEPKKIIFWIGLNGSGKSTLAKVLSGLTQPDSGAIHTKASITYHHQSLAENVFPALKLADHLRLLRRENSRIKHALSVFQEIEPSLDRYPDELSGGQLQLFSFLTLVAERREITILDEVLNHLDVSISQRIMSYISSHLVSPKHSVIIIGHDLKAAYDLADEVVIFAAGKIAASLSRTEFKSRPGMLADLLLSAPVAVVQEAL